MDVYLFYANIILSFLCGSQWSKILNSNISNNRNLLLTLSVLVPVFSFILDFFANQDIKIAIYMVLFFAANFIDGKIFSESSNAWYLNLRKRLTNYTQPERLNKRIARMVNLATKLDFIQTQNELEALLLEHNLIKKLPLGLF